MPYPSRTFQSKPNPQSQQDCLIRIDVIFSCSQTKMALKCFHFKKVMTPVMNIVTTAICCAEYFLSSFQNGKKLIEVCRVLLALI